MRKRILVSIVLLAFALVNTVSAANLISNGGFENPKNTLPWQVYPSSYPGLEWKVEQGIGPLPSTSGYPDNTPTLEIQTLSAIGLVPDEGNQYAELDSYANGNISQMVTLKQGYLYHISFAQTCRPEERGTNSKLGVYLNDILLSSTTCDEIRVWKTHTVDVTPHADIHAKLMFVDKGISVQSYGVLLDNVKVEEERINIPVPEFPTIALPIALLVGIIGAIFFMKSIKEN